MSSVGYAVSGFDLLNRYSFLCVTSGCVYLPMEWVSGTSPDRVYLEVTYCITYQVLKTATATASYNQLKKQVAF